MLRKSSGKTAGGGGGISCNRRRFKAIFVGMALAASAERGLAAEGDPVRHGDATTEAAAPMSRQTPTASAQDASSKMKGQSMPSLNVSAATRDVAQEEANRKLILDIFNSQDLNRLIDHMSDDYKQHNPGVADGKQAAIAFLADMAKRHPKMVAQVERTAADGDLVWIHAHLILEPNMPGVAMVDIFRVKDGKLVEHWDVLQPIPEATANGNSMF